MVEAVLHDSLAIGEKTSVYWNLDQDENITDSLAIGEKTSVYWDLDQYKNIPSRL